MNATRKEPIKINNTHVDEVNNFTYLASIVNYEDDCTLEIKTCISKARQTYGAMRKHSDQR